MKVCLLFIYIHYLEQKNNINLYNKTKIIRSINRSTYDYADIKKMLKSNSSHTSKIYNNIIKLIKVRKNQAAFHPNATQYTLNLGNKFFWNMETKY